MATAPAATNRRCRAKRMAAGTIEPLRTAAPRMDGISSWRNKVLAEHRCSSTVLT
jgi:hypothetical protein